LQGAARGARSRAERRLTPAAALPPAGPQKRVAERAGIPYTCDRSCDRYQARRPGEGRGPPVWARAGGGV